MSLSKPNVSPATLTKNRVKASPVSGICVTCLDGCPGDQSHCLVIGDCVGCVRRLALSARHLRRVTSAPS